MRDVSRRDFLKGVSTLPLAAAIPRSMLARALAATGPHVFFTDHQAEVVREATARLIPGPRDDPSEAGHPGAREAHVTRYIDLMLGAFASHPPKVHAGGPFSRRAGGPVDDMKRFVPLSRIQAKAWRKRLSHLRERYRAGIKMLDQMAGGDFTQAPPPTQDAILAGDQSGFRNVLFTHAIEGMYSVPEYGGNVGLVGWQDIGFPGDSQPRGYTRAQVSTSDGPDPADPAVAAFTRRHFERAVAHVRLPRSRGR